MSDNVTRLKRKPRPLTKTYSPSRPFVVERHDEEDGSIVYEIWDERPDDYRRVCRVPEDPVEDDDEIEPLDRGRAKRDADLIAAALNFYSQVGKC